MTEWRKTWEGREGGGIGVEGDRTGEARIRSRKERSKREDEESEAGERRGRLEERTREGVKKRRGKDGAGG